MAAGGPPADDVIKCQLRPIARADYPGASEADMDRLEEIFPDGVSAYSKPAAEDVERSMLWVSVGGDQLEPPPEPKWRVARAAPAGPVRPTTGAGAGDSSSGGATGTRQSRAEGKR